MFVRSDRFQASSTPEVAGSSRVIFVSDHEFRLQVLSPEAQNEAGDKPAISK
jgi:hypothetical protein